MNAAVKFRIQSVDLLRGIVMIIMALDHTRDYFHLTAMTEDPTNLFTTTPGLFFSRWITHYCAPVFVFLSGTSAFLSGIKKTKKQLAVFLLKRGTWLIVLELTIFNLFLTFNPFYTFIAVQVLWVIGFSMVILAAFIYLPMPVLFITGLVLVCGHNLLDRFNDQPNQTSLWWGFLHQPVLITYAPGRIFAILYPLIPWPGIMMLGYCAGSLYAKDYNPAKRKRLLLVSGIIITVLFVIIRYANSYGDPAPWSIQKDGITTLLSFLNLSKYPPSFLFVCMTIGPALILLSLIEKTCDKLSSVISVYGRVPLFYFLLHFFVIHLACMIVFFINGNTMAQANTGLLWFRPADFGYPLPVVYIIWLALVIMLYPLCKWYDRIRSAHKKWWLSYL